MLGLKLNHVSKQSLRGPAEYIEHEIYLDSL